MFSAHVHKQMTIFNKWALYRNILPCFPQPVSGMRYSEVTAPLSLLSSPFTGVAPSKITDSGFSQASGAEVHEVRLFSAKKQYNVVQWSPLGHGGEKKDVPLIDVTFGGEETKS